MKKEKKVECPCYLFFEEVDGAKTVQGIQPVYQTKHAACADVAVPIRTIIHPHSTEKVDLWIGFEIPEGYCIKMYPRSSLLLKYDLMSPVSIIDSDYSRMHVHVVLHNLGANLQVLEAGTRVAQIECVPVYDCDDWAHSNKTRDGGFGSTGQ